MPFLRMVATLMSLAVTGLGLLGVVAPEALLAFVQSLLTPSALYAVAAVRVVFGAVLIAVASASRAPLVLRLLGAFILAAGLLTPFLDTERFRGVADTLSGHLSLVRGAALVPCLVGLLLAYAINAPRRP